MKRLISLAFCLFACILMNAAESVKSPDGRLEFTFIQDGGLYYTIKRDGKELVSRSRLGVAIENKLFESALAIPNEEPQYWGKGWCNNLKLRKTERAEVDTTWTPVYGEWAKIRDHYNSLTLCFMKGAEDKPDAKGYVKEKCYYFNIKVRAYNEGIAFCYEFPETTNGLFLHITDELTEFNISGNAQALCTSWAQGQYSWQPLSAQWPDAAERPLTIKTDDCCLSLVEARLIDYCQTKFLLEGGNKIKAQPYSSCDVMTPFSTPWRLIMVGNKMTDLCNHDYMVLNLNDEEDTEVRLSRSAFVATRRKKLGSSEIQKLGNSEPRKAALGYSEFPNFRDSVSSFSWINPGKVFRCCNLNRQALLDAVDFIAERGLQYLLLDAGWYGQQMKMSSSALCVDKDRDFTIPEIVEYAKKKNVGVILYVNQRALYQQLDSILPLYEKWGIKGIKFGFVQVGNQMWTTWLHEAVRKCAEHHFLVDIHDEYRPTGYSRTYPNLMTAEGVRGNEEMPTATHNVTIPFTRFLCGPADYTPCYFSRRIKTTKAHQLAMPAVYYSPLTWLFWYDSPSQYNGEPELEFWSRIPTVWDDTKVLQGEPGEYIVTARRSGSDWFAGAMTNNDSRTVTIPLSFLTKGKKYIAHLYEDDPTITADINTKDIKAAKNTKVRCTKRKVTSKTTLTLPLQPSGGAAIWLEEIKK